MISLFPRDMLLRSKTHFLDNASSLNELAEKLRRNEIVDLDLGWKDCDFLRGRRFAAVLEKSLKQNTSLRTVRIGWRYSQRERESVLKLLKAIGKHTNLTHIKLVLDDWIPDTLLCELLQKQQNLVTIDIRAVQVYKQTDDEVNTNQSGATEYDSYCGNYYDQSIVASCFLKQYHQHPKLKVLSLMECGLTDEQVITLADFLHIRGGISELSLRSNRKLTGNGLRMICQAPVMHKLDISLCDLECDDAEAVAEGIAARPWPVQELHLAGNYRVGSLGLLAMVDESCCEKMVKLDMSYCDSKDYRAVMILNSLALLKPSTTLREINLHGSFVGNDVVASSLQKLLSTSTSLRSIRLNDPQDPKPMSAQQLRKVLSGLQQNYELEELVIDSYDNLEEMKIWEQINFILRLNAAGRRILRSNAAPREYSGFPAAPVDDWCNVLKKAGDDSLTVLYWIVRRGSDNFGRFRY